MARLLHFAAAVALGGLATAGLTACTGDAEASPSPTPVVTVSTQAPSPTPTLSAEEELLAQIPEEATFQDFPGAVNFSRFFLDQYPRLFDPGADLSLFEYLSGENCGFCANALQNAADTAARGEYSEGLAFSYDNDTLDGGPEADGYWFVSYRFTVTPSTTYGPDGAITEESPAESGLAKIRLGWDEDHYFVDVIDFDLD